MNFKRGRAKNQRAGCLLCKPHKANGAKDAETLQVLRHDASVEEQVVCAEDALDAQKRRCGSGEYICDECLYGDMLIPNVNEFEQSSFASVMSRPLGTFADIMKRAA